MINKISHYNTLYKKQISLVKYFKDLNVNPDVIKIDVEGAEVLVLKGAKKLISISIKTKNIFKYSSRKSQSNWSERRSVAWMDKQSKL